MITIQFKNFGRWRAVASRPDLAEARMFVARHAPESSRWADSVRFVVDGKTLAYAEACKGAV